MTVSPPLLLKKMADVDDHLIPVRLDLEHDHWKLKDTFMWNCSGVLWAVLKMTIN